MPKYDKPHIVWVSRGPNAIYLNLCRVLNRHYRMSFVCRRAGHLLKPPELVKSFNFVTVPYFNNILNPASMLRDLASVSALDRPDFVYYRGLSAVLDHLIPDLIIGNGLEQPAVWQAANYARRRGLPYILQSEMQRWPTGPMWRKLGGQLLIHLIRNLTSEATYLWTWTDQGRDFARQHMAVQPDQVRTVPAGVDTDIFQVARKPAADGILKLSLAARLVPYKRHQDAILAVNYLRKKHHLPVRLDIIGTDPKGKEYTGTAIRELVSQLGLEKDVIFQARVNRRDMKYFYGDHDINLLTSEYEPIGMVVPEAMACGTPNIVSDTSGAKMYLLAGKNGYTYKTGSAPDLAQAILKLRDRQRREAFRWKAVEHIRNNYALEIVADLMQKYLREKLAPKFT